jgi:nucleoside 2-deoxyribosyltransferase
VRLYLAGPMTNLPQFNYPAFHAAAAKLRAAGHEVISPAEQDPGSTQEEAMASTDGDLTKLKESYGSMMARDVKLIIDDVDGIVVLPGWNRSRGVCIEIFVARAMGKPVWHCWPESSDPRGDEVDGCDIRAALSDYLS